MRASKLRVTVSIAFFATFQRVSPPASSSMLPLRSTSSMAFGATRVMANSLWPQPVPISHLPLLQVLPAAQSPSLTQLPGSTQVPEPLPQVCGAVQSPSAIQRPNGTHTFVLPQKLLDGQSDVARARCAAASSGAADADRPGVGAPRAPTGISGDPARPVLVRRTRARPRDKQNELAEAHAESPKRHRIYHPACALDDARVRSSRTRPTICVAKTSDDTRFRRVPSAGSRSEVHFFASPPVPHY